MSLCSNENGIWSCNYNNTIISGVSTEIMMTVVEFPTNDGLKIAKQGVRINATITKYITSIKKLPTSSVTKAYILDGFNFNILANSSFVGEDASFNYLINSGMTYYLAADCGGDSCQRQRKGGKAYPENQGDIIILSGLSDDTTNVTTAIFDLSNISLSNGVNYTTKQFNRTIVNDTIWTCSVGDSDGVIGYSISNFTILLNRPPQININSPLSTSTNTNVTMNFTFTDDLGLMDYCSYNVTTSGLGVIVADNPINCSNALEYQTISVGTGYIINVFGNDSIGNSNISSLTFDINNPVTPAGGSPGGGGGSTIIQTGTAGWTFETTPGSSSYNKNLPAGTSVRLPLTFYNIGDSSMEISLSCVDAEGSICQYVEFEELTFSLPLVKDTPTTKYFTITLPDEFIKGDYQFNIIATDDLSKAGIVSINIASGTQSVPLEIISKLSLSSKLLGGFPYFAIFGIVLVLTLVVSRKIFPKDGLGTMWGIILAFFLSTIAVYFL